MTKTVQKQFFLSRNKKNPFFASVCKRLPLF